MRELRRRWRRHWAGAALLRVLSLFYALGWAAARLARMILPRPGRVSVPVISVGNLTTGGTGKTPMTAYLAQRLLNEGRRVCVLTRGYKGGDEAKFLAKKFLPSGSLFSVLEGKNRHRSATEFLNSQPATRNPEVVFVMDDGHQQSSLRSDARIILLDAYDKDGLDGLLPRGLLREPISSGLVGCDAVVLTRCDLAPEFRRAELKEMIARFRPDLEVFEAAHRLVRLYPLDPEVPAPGLDSLRDRELILVSAIGNPGAFETLVRDRLGASVLRHFVYADHAAFSSEMLMEIEEASRVLRPAAVLTTTKDAVRLQEAFSAQHSALSVHSAYVSPWYSLEVELDLGADEEKFWTLIKSRLGPRLREPEVRLRHYFEFHGVAFFSYVIRMAPWSALPVMARVLAVAVRILARRRGALVDHNLSQAFPRMPQPARRDVAREFWRRITWTVLEWLWSAGRDPRLLGERVILENPELLEAALAGGRGVLIHTGHFGNWELAGLAICSAGYRLAAIGRTQRNPLLDRWHNGMRRRFGMTVFNHHQAIRETLQWLKGNGCVGILSDQNLYKGGVFVDFLGRPAATTTLTALLRLRAACPIVGMYAYRRGPRHIVRFENIDPGQGAPLELTQNLTRVIERWVKEDPANWLWGHNRWKRSWEALGVILPRGKALEAK